MLLSRMIWFTGEFACPHTILLILMEISRPFKIVGGPEGNPLVEVESGGKTAKYVRACGSSSLRSLPATCTVS